MISERSTVSRPEAAEEAIHRSHTQARDITDALVIREKNLSLVTLQNGDIPLRDNYGYGLYYKDCRFLSSYLLRINGREPTAILSSDERGYSSITMLTNPELRDLDGRPVGKDTISLRRDRFVSGLISETVAVDNFNSHDVTIELSFELGSDFDDIFTIRGIAPSAGGQVLPPAYGDGTLTLQQKGKDRHRRFTYVTFDPAPTRVEGSTCSFALALPHHQQRKVRIVIRAEDVPPGASPLPEDIPLDRRLKMVRASYVETMECCSNVQTDNHIFNKVFLRSLSDLRMLYMINSGHVYYSAGVPWYDALFGRDSLIAAMQVLPYNPAIARSTLQLLARYQGQKRDDWRDEEPGRILHELRLGELANLNGIPQTPYYGSVDSTPLFLVLLAEHVDWTGDMGLYHDLAGAVDAALGWIDANTNEDHFLVYESRSAKGLYNQGWKDSFDAISHSDGSLARAPIALPEVQGYVYEAKRRMALLFDRLGREDRAKRLRREAAGLYWSFNEKFWMPGRSYYAEAIDAQGQCKVISSNPGQALWGEIVDPARADALVQRLFSPELFTGWGVRTLAAGEARYNPLGYHNGTVWPHDNSLIAMGLGNYGRKEELLRLFTCLYEAAGSYKLFRLPELFGGFPREVYDIPIRYPVANSPQAWSAGSIPYLLTAALGLVPHATEQRLTLVKPSLPAWLEKVRINSLHVGNAAARLEFQRVGESTLVNVVEKRGDLEVDIVY